MCRGFVLALILIVEQYVLSVVVVMILVFRIGMFLCCSEGVVIYFAEAL